MHYHYGDRCLRVWFNERDDANVEVAWTGWALGLEWGMFCPESQHLHAHMGPLALWLSTRPFAWQAAMARSGCFNGWAYAFNVGGDGVTVSHGFNDGKPRNWPWHFEWPWKRWQHVRHDVLSEPETHPYRYRLRSGEVQEREATIKVEEREWHWMWVGNPLRRNIKRYIDVEFSDEVGEESGSWKGGCIGCGYDIHPGETPLDTLRRMEREKTF